MSYLSQLSRNSSFTNSRYMPSSEKQRALEKRKEEFQKKYAAAGVIQRAVKRYLAKLKMTAAELEAAKSASMFANRLANIVDELKELQSTSAEDGDLKGKIMEKAVMAWWTQLGFIYKGFVDKFEFNIICAEMYKSQLDPGDAHALDTDVEAVVEEGGKYYTMESLDDDGKAAWDWTLNLDTDMHKCYHIGFDRFWDGMLHLLEVVGVNFKTQTALASYLHDMLRNMKERTAGGQWLRNAMNRSTAFKLINNAKSKLYEDGGARIKSDKEKRKDAKLERLKSENFEYVNVSQEEGTEGLHTDPAVDAAQRISASLNADHSPGAEGLSLALRENSRQSGIWRVWKSSQGNLSPEELAEVKRLAEDAVAKDPQFQQFQQFMETGGEKAEKYQAMFNKRVSSLSTGSFNAATGINLDLGDDDATSPAQLPKLKRSKSGIKAQLNPSSLQPAPERLLEQPPSHVPNPAPSIVPNPAPAVVPEPAPSVMPEVALSIMPEVALSVAPQGSAAIAVRPAAANALHPWPNSPSPRALSPLAPVGSAPATPPGLGGALLRRAGRQSDAGRRSEQQVAPQRPVGEPEATYRRPSRLLNPIGRLRSSRPQKADVSIPSYILDDPEPSVAKAFEDLTALERMEAKELGQLPSLPSITRPDRHKWSGQARGGKGPRNPFADKQYQSVGMPRKWAARIAENNDKLPPIPMPGRSMNEAANMARPYYQSGSQTHRNVGVRLPAASLSTGPKTYR